LVNFDYAASSNYLAPIFDPLTFASRAYRFDGYSKADLGATYTIPFSESRSLKLFGNVDNLFDNDYFESGFRTPGRTGRAGAMFVF
jgi:outer membrane receptor protein involved in Fe transport